METETWAGPSCPVCGRRSVAGVRGRPRRYCTARCTRIAGRVSEVLHLVDALLRTYTPAEERPGVEERMARLRRFALSCASFQSDIGNPA